MHIPRYLDQPYLLAGRRIDPITGTLSYREVQKHLRRKELEVLALLAAAGGEQVARSVFIEQVWQGNPIVGEQGLTDTISALRRSLLDTDRENPLILTIPRRGYQLRASIRSISRDGGVAFVARSVIDGRPDWRLKQLLEQTDAHESWLAEDGRSRRIFRFCRNEQQLRKLRREVVLMRYLREALASQEHVSTILDWQLEEPPYFLELAAPACGNLRGVMLGKSVPELAERWRLMQEVTEALAAVHAAGVVHRALSPDSVLVDRRKGERVALLGEFGLAALDDRQRLAELGIDAEGLSLKTGLLGPATAYTAPECVAGAPASAASDVYALGVLIAQTLRGDFQRLEFEGFPDPIAGLLQRCVAADPATRPTAAELAGSLQAWIQPTPAPRRAEPPIVPTPPAPIDAPPVAAPAAVAVAPTLPEAAAPPLTPVPLIPQRIGRYRIVSELAQGGMGVVYLAEQSEPVQRRVALKLIRAGLDSEQVLARFEAERQALAMMSHPNISAIFDAGSTPGGYPYFVMEFVPGKDIVSHCDDAKLNLRARIRLFLQVCDGVLHAHQKGVIHRDLKPSNILVGSKSDHAALVKLIDFGVAKSLTGGLGGGLHTRVGSFIGTPVYSCPEQVIDPTRDIDTRADLYSLGVVLYEILVGVPPRSARELDADTPAELARRLRDTQTPAMGSRYTGLSPEERQRVAELRTLSIDGLSMQLCSDLDWIVGKCVAQDPEDRYATVQDLRQDLQRWLDDRPVEARPTSNWYRLRKLVRRNRLNTAIIVASITLLLVSSAAAIFGFTRAAHEAALARDAAEKAEQIAQFQQRQWEQMNAESMGIRLRERMNGVLEQSASTQGQAEPLPLLDQFNFTDLIIRQLREDYFQPALTAIDKDYADRPALQHQLRQSIAESLYSLGIYDMALEVQESALRQRQALFGPAAEATLHSLFQRGQIHSAMAESGLAKADFDEVHRQWTAIRGSDDPDSVIARFAAARESEVRDVPIQIYRETLAQRLASHGENDDWVIDMRLALAAVLSRQSQHDAAMAELQAAIRATDADQEKRAERRIQILTTLGTIARNSGDIRTATEHFENAYRIARPLYGSAHSATLGAANALAYGLIFSGRAAEAEVLMRKVLADWQPIHGKNNSWTIWLESIIADTAWCQGRLQEGLELMADAASRMKRDHNDGFSIAQYHGRFLRELGQLDQARKVLEEAISWGGDSERNGALIDLGELEHAAGNLVLAEQILSSVHAALLEQNGASYRRTLWAASRLGAVWGDMGRVDQARQLLEQTWPKEHPWWAFETIRLLADLEFRQGNLPRARELAQKAAELGRQHVDPRSLEWADLQKTLALVQSD